MTDSRFDDRTGLEVAIIGMAVRVPGAPDLGAYWENLAGGVESFTDLSDEHLDSVGVAAESRSRPTFCRRTRNIPDVDRFDAGFFGISPREAEIIDPQQRLFLELAWTALEDAGYDPERLSGAVGVYGGARMPSYLTHLYGNPAVMRNVGDIQVQTANDKDYLATRVAYKLNLGGPAVTVQTACSTSLVALHLACQGLISGECDMALAGGVAVRTKETGFNYVEGNVASPDGRIRSFDAKANGTIFGSGLGIVVVKRLDDALADGDHIYAVVRGTAVTNDGSDKVGFTAPGVDGQVRVIRAAQMVAEVDPETITYVEAHGTGTPLGDPIEVSALTKAFRERTDRTGYCALGSVKTNIGHLGAAAGAAAVIKTALALEKGQIPASLLFETPNPQIDFESSPFFVNTELRPWEPAPRAPRRAGVSSFGMGGTNAHAVLEEAPPAGPTAPSRPHQLLLLSALSEAALDEATANLGQFLAGAGLDDREDVSLADVAFTLERGRRRMPLRRAVVASSAAEAADLLRGEGQEGSAEGVVQDVATGSPGVVFLFSGQGSQYPDMARDLYRGEPVFRAALDRCSELLEPHLGRKLVEVIYPDEAGRGEAEELLGRTAITQPALFALEWSLAELWASWGVVPDAMIGHSIGEYVAACRAGVFSLEDALALVAARGRLMDDLPAGDMLAVPLPEEDLQDLLGPELSVAAVNSPGRSVVSGPADAVADLVRRLEEQGTVCRPLHTSHAFHSPMMEPILAPFVERFESLELEAPRIPFVSNVTGTWIRPEEATDPGYWARHLRGTVRFAQGIETLLAEPGRVLLEVGPGNSLTTLARQGDRKRVREAAAGAKPTPIVASVRHPKTEGDDRAVVLEALGRLWAAGVEVDWSGYWGDEARRRVSLPGYPFQRLRYWIDEDPDAFGAPRFDNRRREDVTEWFHVPAWQPSMAPPAGEDSAGPGQLRAVLHDGGPLAEALLESFRGEGIPVVSIRAGDGYAADQDGRFTLRPGEKEDWEHLLRDLANGPGMPAELYHLWNLDDTAPGDTAAEGGDRAGDDLDALQARGFWSLLFLAQALSQRGHQEPMRTLVVSSGVHALGGEERLVPERATLLGPVRVAPLEVPSLVASSVDVTVPADAAERAELIELLRAEAAGGKALEVVAYRGGERQVREVRQVLIGPQGDEAVRLRPEGSYLITGGLGGIGLSVAKYLAETYRARLILVGRSPLPPREEWDEILTTRKGDRAAGRIRKVLELEEMGSKVLVLGGDVTDREAMDRVVADALEGFGEIHGVVHAAGLPGGGVIQLKAPETAAAVIDPKLLGTLALEGALADRQAGAGALDFFLVCSSTIALAGGVGQVDYCAANSFLDAWAHARTAEARKAGAGRDGTRYLSVNWGAWEEVGMAVAAGLTTARTDGGEDADREPAAAIHPLVDRLIRESVDQTIYGTTFSTETTWILDEHRILQVPALPGTTYLELARATFLHHGAEYQGLARDAGVMIEDLFFVTPLQVPEGKSREARMFLEKDGEGFSFRVVSNADGSEDEDWQLHVRGSVRALPEDAAPPTWDLGELRALCDQGGGELPTGGEEGGGVASDRQGMVFWGEHWQTIQEVQVGEGRGLARLRLQEKFEDELGEMPLHPALVDVATGVVSFLEKETYLPLSYGRVRFHRQLTPELWSYIRLRPGSGGGKETLTADVTLLDPEGNTLVEIERFAMKRVGSAAAALASQGAAAGAAAAASDEPSDEAAGEAAVSVPEPAMPGLEGLDAPDPAGESAAATRPPVTGILPEEGVEAFRRVLSRRFKGSQVAASARDVAVLIASIEARTQADLLGSQPSAGASEVHSRPDIASPYVAPRTELESQLAEIWQSILGIDQVGVDDNFFDLGGDSIMGIQVVARGKDLGLDLSPDQLFEHQTVAELALALDVEDEAEQGPPPLTAPQRYFARLGRALVAPVPLAGAAPGAEDLEPALGRAWSALVEQRPLLARRFVDGVALEPEAGSEEDAGTRAEPLPVLRATPDTQAAAEAELAGRLDPAQGRTVGVLAVDRGADGTDLRLVGHGAVLDGRSLEQLGRELASALVSLSLGEAVLVAEEETSFARWARQQDEALAGEASSLDEALSTWKAEVSPAGLELPTDPAGAGSGWGHRSAALDAETTTAFLEEVPAAIPSRPLEGVAAALARALAAWADDGREVLVEIHRDGRRSPEADDAVPEDLEATVGCFTVPVPVRLSGSGDSAGADLVTAKERLRRAAGEASGWLRLLVAEDAAARDLVESTRPVATIAWSEGTPAAQPVAGARPLELAAGLAEDGTLHLALAHERQVVGESRAQELLEALTGQLQALVDHSRGVEETVLSTADFPEADLSDDDLAKVLANLE